MDKNLPMPVIRLSIDQASGRARVHGGGGSPAQALGRAAAGTGPIILMVHGYKYDPALPQCCPQRLIFGDDHGWPALLGLGAPGAPLGVTFGWRARGPLAQVFERATALGRELARIIALLHRIAPHRALHLIAHSMGAEVALSALRLAPKGSIARVIVLTGASFTSHATAALNAPAGRTAELFNVVSRENDLFDFAFEQMIPAHDRRDRALGQGLSAVNAMTIQLDCPTTLRRLAALGSPIAPSARRICHWSGYTRPGAMAFYARLMSTPQTLPLPRLAQALPPRTAPRWSRLDLGFHLANRRKPASWPPAPIEGIAHDRPHRPLLLAYPQRLENLHRA